MIESWTNFNTNPLSNNNLYRIFNLFASFWAQLHLHPHFLRILSHFHIQTNQIMTHDNHVKHTAFICIYIIYMHMYILLINLYIQILSLPHQIKQIPSVILSPPQFTLCLST